MKNIAQKWNENISNTASATVKSIIEERYLLVDDEGRVAPALRAVSCLVEPIIGDRVLFCHSTEANYVLAVLARPQEGASGKKVSLDGDVTFEVPNGKFNITAKDGIHLASPEDLSLIAKRVGLSGETLASVFQKIDLMADSAQANLSDIKFFSKRIRSKVETAMQHFTRRQVKVDSLDSVEAGTIQQTAREMFSLKSVFAFVKAKKNVKIDGKQIFMG